MALTMTVYLVRHGQSEWNVAGRVQGQTRHPHLTELGRRQAEATGAQLARMADGEPTLLTSDLVRAEETAELISSAIGVPARTDRRLREKSMGTLEGMTSAAAFEQLDGADWTDSARLGGARSESVGDVAIRVGELLAGLMADDATRTAVLVSHGDTIRIAAAWLASTSAAEQFGWESLVLANGSITVARLRDGVLVELEDVVEHVV
jgi:probable phosphoglycerate mutase